MKITSCFAIITLVILAVGGCSVMVQHGTIEELTATVNGKEAVLQSTGDGIKSTYLIYTDVETFENSDAMFHGKFNSSDVYGEITSGQTYRIKAYGWRIPFFSMYRNIVSINPVSQ